MPDYAPNFTPRYRVRYRANGATHTQTWRFTADADLAGAIADVQDYYTAIQGDLDDQFTVLSGSWAAQDSDIFLPADPVVVAGGQDLTGGPPSLKAIQLDFVGRTSGGLRMIIYQYGYGLLNPGLGFGDDFRITAAENLVIDAAISALNGAGFLCGNDDLAGVWYPYANLKYNDYWMRKVRQG